MLVNTFTKRMLVLKCHGMKLPVVSHYLTVFMSKKLIEVLCGSVY